MISWPYQEWFPSSELGVTLSSTRCDPKTRIKIKSPPILYYQMLDICSLLFLGDFISFSCFLYFLKVILFIYFGIWVTPGGTQNWILALFSRIAPGRLWTRWDARNQTWFSYLQGKYSIHYTISLAHSKFFLLRGFWAMPGDAQGLFLTLLRQFEMLGFYLVWPHTRWSTCSVS